MQYTWSLMTSNRWLLFFPSSLAQMHCSKSSTPSETASAYGNPLLLNLKHSRHSHTAALMPLAECVYSSQPTRLTLKYNAGSEFLFACQLIICWYCLKKKVHQWCNTKVMKTQGTIVVLSDSILYALHYVWFMVDYVLFQVR